MFYQSLRSQSRDGPSSLHQTFRQSDLPPGGGFLIVGDIHGELGLLEKLLKLSEYDPAHDVLIALGDLIDRGPSSYDAVRWFAEYATAHSLLGNHEAMMLEAEHSPRALALWHRNGGRWALDLSPEDHASCIQWISQFPLTIELHLHDGRTIGLVHAEVRLDQHWSEARLAEFAPGDGTDESDSTTASLIWGRTRLRAAVFRSHKSPRLENRNPHPLFQVPGVDLLIAGHSIDRSFRPLRAGNCLWIDSGAYLRKEGGVLTLVDPGANVYWQVGHQEADTCGPIPLPEPPA